MRLPGIRTALRDQPRRADRPHPAIARLCVDRDNTCRDAFGTATLLEIAAYYIPWFDHLLDTIATPAAVVAGMVASASVMVDLPPVLKWGVALIGGGGAAGLLQGATVLLRLKSLRRPEAPPTPGPPWSFSARPARSFSRSCCHSCAWRSQSFSAYGYSARRGTSSSAGRRRRPQPRMELEERWEGAWFNLGSGRPDPRVLAELLGRYTEPHRAYHNLEHLKDCFRRFDEVHGLARYPAEVLRRSGFTTRSTTRAQVTMKKRAQSGREMSWSHPVGRLPLPAGSMT